MSRLGKAAVAVVVVSACFLAIYEVRRASRLSDRLEILEQKQSPLAGQLLRLQRERDGATSRLAAVEEENSRLKTNQPDAEKKLVELLKLRGEVGRLRLDLASAEANTNSPSSGIAKLLSDPAMREYFRQSRMSFVKAQFGPLFKELNLTPEQTEKVVQVMGDLADRNIEKFYSHPQGTFSAAEVEQLMAGAKAELKTQLLPLLGESGFTRLVEFRERFPAEATLALVNGQLGANQLSEEQASRLFQTVKAEPFDLTRGISGDWDPVFLAKQEEIDKHLQQIAESNQRVLEQARAFLKPDQLSALNTVLANGVNERIRQAEAFIQKP